MIYVIVILILALFYFVAGLRAVEWYKSKDNKYKSLSLIFDLVGGRYMFVISNKFPYIDLSRLE